MLTMQFTVDFPRGLMEGKGISDLVDWIAKGVRSKPVTVNIGDKTYMLSIDIPDTYAHVHPFRGQGYVDAFQTTVTLTEQGPSNGGTGATEAGLGAQ